MIPDHIIAAIEDLGACTSARAVLDLIEARLQKVKRERRGAKVSRAGAGTILAFDQDPQSSRSGPDALAILVKIPGDMDAAMRDTMHVHDDRVSGRGISKLFIVATLLDWLDTIVENHMVSALRLAFYEWHDRSIAAMDQFAAVFPIDHALAWFLEPTGMLACPAEKGFGKFTVSIAPGKGTDATGLPRAEIIAKLAAAIAGRFKPSHPVYPLDPANRLSFRFLPGAQIATPVIAASQNELHVTFSHHPLADQFKQEVAEFINTTGAKLGTGTTLRVKTDYHFPGAKFSVAVPKFQQFIATHKQLSGKEPYLEWHVNPSMASVVYKHHPAASGVVFGPGDPFVPGDDQDAITAKDADDSREFLETLGSNLLFKVS
nr:hypothetical protein [Candidatus Sigynarchaeota archaeon]